MKPFTPTLIYQTKNLSYQNLHSNLSFQIFSQPHFNNKNIEVIAKVPEFTRPLIPRRGISSQIKVLKVHQRGI